MGHSSNKYNDNNKSNADSKNSFSCRVCNQEIGMENVFLIDECQHKICRDCARTSIKNDVINHKQLPQCPICLTQKVNKVCMISQFGVELVLEGKDLEKYHQLCVNKVVNSYSCPTPRCTNIVHVDETVSYFKCGACKLSSCVKCNATPYHYKQTCQEYARQQQRKKQS